MAFLRTICAQRSTTNLVYSYSGSSSSNSSSLGVGGKYYYFIGSKVPSSVRQLSYDASDDNDNESGVKSSSSSSRRVHHHHCHYLQQNHNQYFQPQQQKQLLAKILFAPVFNHRQLVHTDAAKSQTVTATTLDEDKSISKKEERFRPPAPKIPENPQRDPLDVGFNDPLAAFKSKTTWELVRAYVVYMICSFEKIVEHNMTIHF
uniref:Proline dehydrogenase n=1 Tax=Glossina brevipalpis TaxID=37001 RepID=A0A1A9W9H4_9MUSC